MTAEVEKLLDAFLDIRDQANVDACFGRPVEFEGRTVIPVATVKYGLGMGAEDRQVDDAESPAEGAAGPHGGGMKSSPLGFVEVTDDGIFFEPILDEQKVAIAGVLLAAWSVFWLAQVLMALLGWRE